MNSSFTCDLCGKPITSDTSYGVCTRTKTCKAEYNRRYRQRALGKTPPPAKRKHSPRGETKQERRGAMKPDELFNVLHGLFVAIDTEAPDVHEFCARGEEILAELRTKLGLQPRGPSSSAVRREPRHAARQANSRVA